MKKIYETPVIEICNYSTKAVACAISEGTEYGPQNYSVFDLFAVDEGETSAE